MKKNGLIITSLSTSLLLFSILSWFITPCHADELVTPENTISQYQQALEELKSNHIIQAYGLLESIPTDSLDFLPSLVELQKIHYKSQLWDRFFSYALFYRKKLLKIGTGKEKTENFQGRLFTLETLALGKHCLWDEARGVIEAGIQIATSMQSEELNELEQTLHWIELLHEYPKLKVAAVGPAQPKPIFSLQNYWPVGTDLLKTVSHPKALRFKIQGKCLP